MSLKQCIIMRGISGSGKSTYAENADGYILSTDNYWYRPDGFYDFNAKRLGEAHAWNLEDYRALCRNDFGWDLSHLVAYIDNTNLVLKNFIGYLKVSQENNIPVKVVTVVSKCSIEELVRRNLHGLTKGIILNQMNRFDKDIRKTLDDNGFTNVECVDFISD